MSIKVTVEDLPDEIAARGAAAFVCTVSDPPITHLTHTTIDLVDGRLVCETGASSRRNATERPSIVLLWPAREPGDFSLIVDGVATTTEVGLSVEPTSAVLHRPADPEA